MKMADYYYDKIVSKEEFCRKTGISTDCWIFNDPGDREVFFANGPIRNRVVNEPRRYYFFNGKIMREFKHVKKYGELWMRAFDLTAENPKWTLWSAFKQEDE